MPRPEDLEVREKKLPEEQKQEFPPWINMHGFEKHRQRVEILKRRQANLKKAIASDLAHLSESLDIESYGLTPRQAAFLWALWVEMEKYRGDEMKVMKELGVTWAEVRQWETEKGYKKLLRDLQKAYFDTMGRKAAYEVGKYFDQCTVDNHTGKPTNRRKLAPQWVVKLALTLSGVEVGEVAPDRRRGLAEEMALKGIDEMVLAIRARRDEVGGEEASAQAGTRELPAGDLRVSSVRGELPDHKEPESADGSASVEQGAEVLEESLDRS